jgi:dipeptidyl aminopeptidase/acylaminoacyl peptidase
VRDTGGELEILLSGQMATNTRALPGGSAVLFTNPRGGVYFAELGSDSSRVIVTEALDARFIEQTGHLVWVDNASVMWAAPFDPAVGELTGERVFLLDGLTVVGGFASYSISDNGTLVYTTGAGRALFREPIEVLEVVNMDGEVTPVELSPRSFGGPRWSPDGNTIAYAGRAAGQTSGGSGIYLYDTELQTAPRLISDRDNARSPVWSTDGTRIAFVASDEDEGGIFVREISSDEPSRMLAANSQAPELLDWPDGDVMAFRHIRVGAPRGLFLLELTDGDSTGVSDYYSPEANAFDLRVSPDGSLAAYTSTESGEAEVYIRSFPTPRAEVLVSEGGGRRPRWSSNGTTLYYESPGDSIFAARLQLEPTPAVQSREPIMAAPFGEWSVHPDDDRLITVRAVESPDDEPEAEPEEQRHFIVTNWFEELRARTGGSDDGR